MADTRREQIEFVCKEGWAGVRREAMRLLGRGGLASLEGAATLVAEAEMRDQIPADDVFPEQVWARLRQAGSELGWLPARRSELEHGLEVWRSTGPGGAASLGRHSRVCEPLTPGRAPRVVRVETAEPRALAAFDSIVSDSNGRAAAAEVVLDEIATPTRGVAAAIAGVFDPLLLKDRHRVAVAFGVPARNAALDVLHIGVNGGAYDSGSGVRGRLGAWRTLAFMAGAARTDSFEAVHAKVAGAAWMKFDTEECPWFENVAWDGCLACIVAGESGARVLAWTDTD